MIPQKVAAEEFARLVNVLRTGAALTERDRYLLDEIQTAYPEANFGAFAASGDQLPPDPGSLRPGAPS